MGLERFGVFTLAWMSIQFVSSFQMAIITAPMLSIGPKQTAEESPAYYGAVFVKQLIFCGISFFLLVVGGYLSRDIFPSWQGDSLAIPLATTAVAFQTQDFIRRYFFSRGQVANAFINDCISYGGQLLIFLWMAEVTHIDSVRAIWVIGTTSGMATLVGIFSIHRIVIDRQVFRAVMIRHWHFSKWLLLKMHINQLTTYPLMWSLGFFRGSEEVGILNASKNIVGVLHVIYLSLDNIIQPRASRLMATLGLDASIQYILRVIQIAAIPVVAVCLAAAIFPRELTTMFYGSILHGHEDVMILFAASYFVAFLEKPFSYILLTLEQTRLMALSDVSKLIVVLTLSVPIVKLYGATGVMAIIVFLNVLGISILLFACSKSLAHYFTSYKVVA